MSENSQVRTAAELERKYNLSKFVNNVNANLENNGQQIVKVNNELTSMINSLIINLGDVLDSQSDISLWFYSGIPTTSNEPYTNWTTPADHLGDLYYNQESGYVYKYTNNGWIRNEDINLINAMALTNAELDTTEDNERKVFITQPVTPYQSGDWWLLEDGTLKICQLGKEATDTYNDNDFVVSSKYTTTVATKQGDTITVLKGTVTEITENYVKYTDLSTGGSTTIAGENVTTGNLISNNYVSGTSGTKISLENGTIDSKNFKLNEVGDIDVGGYIKTNKGILSNFQFNNYGIIGQVEENMEGMHFKIGYIELSCYIPENFEIVDAKITLNCFKTHNNYMVTDGNFQELSAYGKVRNIKLYKLTSNIEIENTQYGIFDTCGESSEIAGVFGTNGYTSPIIEHTSITTNNIKSSINTSGITIFHIKTSDEAIDGSTYAGTLAAAQQAQYTTASLNIIGYMSVDSEEV